MYTIQNDVLQVTIDRKGAELKSVRHQANGLEYMWGADPAYWAKTSPVLFPIVGTLKDNQYAYQGKRYSLSRHGFAREQEFAVAEQEENALVFFIESNEQTLQVYPFPFRFSIRYALEGDELSVAYRVENKGGDKLLFSVGGHPAFRVPLVEGTSYEDYQLVFEKEEEAGRWPISKDGLIEKEPQPLLRGTRVLPLSKALFSKDALVFKGLQSEAVLLSSPQTDHGLRFRFPGFPFLGLWAAPGADFLCIEPWCGIADSVDHDQQLAHKEGIVSLSPGGTWSVQWTVQFY